MNINLSLIRPFPIREQLQLQFRGSFFNLPNHPNFGNPTDRFEGAGLGIVSAARPGRQIQIVLRLTY